LADKGTLGLPPQHGLWRKRALTHPVAQILRKLGIRARQGISRGVDRFFDLLALCVFGQKRAGIPKKGHGRPSTSRRNL
jgi:hypothetical protein